MRLCICLFLLVAAFQNGLAQSLTQPLDEFVQQKVVEEGVRLDSDDRVASYLRLLDPGQLRIVRNAIFARHGRTFSDTALQAYFDDQSWYERGGQEVSLSPIETQNVEFIQALEEEARAHLNQFYSQFPDCNFPVRVSPEQEPGYATRLASSDVDVFLTSRSGYGRYFAGCTLNRTEQYRALLYVYESPAGAGGNSYRVVSFDSSGRRISDEELLRFGGDLAFSMFGTLVIPRTLQIEVEQSRVETGLIRNDRKKIHRETKWKWFEVRPDGRVARLDPE